MRKTAIIYASTHHGNTRKLVHSISETYDITLVDAAKEQYRDLSGYDLIGFASGIDFGKFYIPVETFLAENLPKNKKVFFLYTCAKTSPKFTRTVRAAALQKGAIVLGEYGCRGYNTYGPWKWVGGMNKKHPTAAEIKGAVQFYKSLLLL